MKKRDHAQPDAVPGESGSGNQMAVLETFGQKASWSSYTGKQLSDSQCPPLINKDIILKAFLLQSNLLFLNHDIDKINTGSESQQLSFKRWWQDQTLTLASLVTS